MDERDFDLMEIEAEAFLDKLEEDFEQLYKGARYGDLQGEANAVDQLAGEELGNESGAIAPTEQAV